MFPLIIRIRVRLPVYGCLISDSVKKALKLISLRADVADVNAVRMYLINTSSVFFHPDFTVGTGISPVQHERSRTLPPVGNLTLP